MNHTEFQAEIARSDIRPIYLLAAGEDLLRREALAKIKQVALDTASLGLNYSELDAGSAPIEDVVAAARTYPMMSPRRLVIVRGLSSLDSKSQKKLEVYLRDPTPTTVLILFGDDLDGRTAFYRTLKRHATLLEFPKMKGFALEKWAGEMIRSRGYKVSASAVRDLVDLAGADLQSVVSEIEKVFTYCGENKIISNSTVRLLVRESRQRSVFELTNAIGIQDRTKALGVLAGLLESGEAPLMIVVMLARHFRQVLVVKEMLAKRSSSEEIIAAARVPAFLVKQFFAQSRQMDRRVAERMYLLLAEADRRFKSSGVSHRHYLEKIICSL